MQLQLRIVRSLAHSFVQFVRSLAGLVRQLCVQLQPTLSSLSSRCLLFLKRRLACCCSLQAAALVFALGFWLLCFAGAKVVFRARCAQNALRKKLWPTNEPTKERKKERKNERTIGRSIGLCTHF